MECIMVIAGEEALTAYDRGERNRKVLRDLGVCMTYQFETEGERRAFVDGFTIATRLVRPIAVPAPEGAT